MPLKVPSEDRILNRFGLINTTDKTLLNADNVMLIFDNLINGQYALKPAKQYITYEELQSETEMEAGQTAYVLEQAYRNTLFIYNGTEWITIVGSSADYTIKEKEYTINPNDVNVITDLDLDNVVSYIVLLNGMKISQTNGDYIVSTTNNISTIVLNETNEGIITIIYQ